MPASDIASLRTDFENDGVVCIRAALDEPSMRMALEAFEWSLEHPSRNCAQFQGTASSPDKFYQDLLNPEALTGYRKMLEQSRAADVIVALWNRPDVWFMYEQVFLKEGGESRRTPWHQDSSYLPIEGNHIAVMWITFEPVAKADSLEFVRRSHRGPLYDGSRFDPNDDTAPIYGDGSLPRLPNIEAARDRFDIVSWEVEPGDVLIFHPAMLHGGAPTHAGRRRRTLSLRFFGDDAVFVKRPGGRAAPESSTSIMGDLYSKLSPGQPFRHPGFPKVRPRSAASSSASA
jgi:ectoine hydroxylase-related dioxygenase (phytanoyl-CoA dioxygenase family)